MTADTPTTRLGLYRSDPTGVDLVNYAQDLGSNWAKIDAAIGWVICTSTTRPASPWNGMAISETDTGRFYTRVGTNWVEHVTPAAQTTFTNSSIWQRAAPTNLAIRGMVAADTNDRVTMDVSGRFLWGSGSATADVAMARTAAGLLEVSTGTLKNGGSLFARKTADTARTATTATADPDLQLTLAANSAYEISGELYTSSTDFTNGQFLIDWTGPADVDGRWCGLGIDTASTMNSGSPDRTRWITTVIDNPSVGSRTFKGISAGDIVPVKLSGIVLTTTGGAFQLLWCRSGTGGTITVAKHSYLKLTRLA